MAAMVLLCVSSLLAFIFLISSAGSTTPALVSTPGTSRSNTTDHVALMSFKSLVRSDPSGALVSWGNRSVPMCQWHGVACGLSGSRRGRVVGLDLADLNLLGTITPALGNLTYMRRINLPRNHFHGILPPELGNLKDLETLQLNFNSIQGQLPTSLSNCRHLVEISANGNQLEGEIPSEFSSLNSLEQLILGENRLTGRIPSNIGTLVNLKTLVLQFNNMTGEIPSEIGSLVNLVALGLGSNQFSGTIPTSLGNLSALNALSIHTNNFEGNIPPLQGLLSLNVLELAQNKLQGTIPSWLGNLSSLVFLDLQVNDLMGQIPESLANLELLTTLELSYNNIAGSITHEIGKLHNLIQLSLANNELKGSLPPSLHNLTSLEILDIQFNNLTGALFPANLGSEFTKLNYFLVSYNQFHGMLPSSLCNASMLLMIEAAGNFLSGAIPQCLGTRQNNLSVVSLSENRFETTNDADWGFLATLTNCGNLSVFDVGTNKLEGLLPNSIGNLSTRLVFLSIENNNITGEITEEIGNLINLNELYMDHNSLIGSIPASLRKLKKLDRLSLSNNDLSGPIPVTLGNLTKLTTFILSNNMINGSIPSSLSNCSLQALDLSQNDLSGPVTKELFSISTLSSFMYLAHNSLSGTLPSEVRNLKNLGALDLSNNKFSGEIPTSIGECRSLEHLNISNNIFQGTIPQSIGNLKGLLMLDLSYNNLSGSIPEILGSLRGLSSLNLSFNKFQGGVPTDGVFLNATAILITGNDGLCGGIPQLKLPPCSNTTTKESPRKLAIVASICSAFLFIALVFAVAIFYHKSWKTGTNLQRSAINEQYMRVSYAELANATNGFASENLIGAGSFGSVYKGIIRGDGQQVVIAVKVLNLMQRGAYQSFVAECETLRCARHRNLLKILTVCSSNDFQGRDFKALVYEFLPNGNLHQRLHQHIVEDGEQKALNLFERLHIAIDVASSLEYLHQYKPNPIIHCDLKPSNILLDSDMVAHVADFGLARFLYQDTCQSSGWASMRGSIGYAAPEYGLGNEVTTQGDVYSYGILLLEMFTGRRPTDSEFGEAMGLRSYVQMGLPQSACTVVDQQLLIQSQGGEAGTSSSCSARDMRIACMSSILQVGIWCSEETPMDRPPIGDALKELQAVRDKFHMHLAAQEHH